MAEKYKKGDQVEWNTSHGKTNGEVVEELTSPTNIKSQHINASEDKPKYLVESNKSGKQAAHNPDALKKVEE